MLIIALADDDRSGVGDFDVVFLEGTFYGGDGLAFGGEKVFLAVFKGDPKAQHEVDATFSKIGVIELDIFFWVVVEFFYGLSGNLADFFEV